MYGNLGLRFLCSLTIFGLLCLKVIAATVASDPTQYSEAFLGKPNEEYCTWILNPEKWGGELCTLIL